MKVLVIGGKGMISRQVVKQIQLANHEVAIFDKDDTTSSNSSVRQIVGDRFNHNEFLSVMKREKFDVVIDMLCFSSENAVSLLDIFRGKVEQLIITSSVAAYNRPTNTLPIKEDYEELNKEELWPYGIQKANMERTLHKAIEIENYPITIVRPSLTYGYGAVNIGVLRQNYGIVDRIKRGKPLVMFGDGKNPWSFTFAPDLARGFAGLVGNKSSYGQAYHICNEDLHIWEDLYLEFGKRIGKEPNIVYLPSAVLYKAAPALCDHIYFEKSFAGIYDNSKIRTVIPDFRAKIALSEGVEMLCDYFEKEKISVDPKKDKLEDDLAEIYFDCSEKVSGITI